MNIFRKISSKIKRLYVKKKYRHVINDLSIRSNESYSTFGTYVTLKKRKPLNYYKKHKTLFYDKEGLITDIFENRNGDKIRARDVILIAQQGLSEYGYFLNDKKSYHLERMNIVANWLLETQENDGVWPQRFDYYRPNTSSWLCDPWVTAMGQGQAISFLCRFYKLTNDKKYLECALNGLPPFLRPLEKRGCCSSFNGNVIYEEYPDNPCSHTLNGFIYSLFGLYDLYVCANSELSRELFLKGVCSLKQLLPYYDSPRFSYYDLGHITAPYRKPCENSKYHVLHVKLLYNLYSITHEALLREYANKWEKQL